MRRFAILLAMVSPIVLGLGCRSIMGKCDCGGEGCSAGNHQAGPSNPYPQVGAPVSNTPATTTTTPMGK